MKRLGIKTAVLSLTAPGACILKGQASYDLARKCNEYCAELRDKDPNKWGFFATLPSLLDTEAALAEIAYALDVLKADGVTVFTRYGAGNTYLGHADLEPIWKELDARKAVVFVHPTHPVDTTKVNAKMPQPLIDYPHETTRTAMDMIIAGTRRKFPNCKVILSHAGGALPYLISRVATPLQAVPDLMAKSGMGLTHEQAMADFRSFHFDVALSASPPVLQMLQATVPHDHILYGVCETGYTRPLHREAPSSASSSSSFPPSTLSWLTLCQSDFPYAPAPAYKAFSENLEHYEMDGGLRTKINHGNASTLIPRLANRSSL